MAILGAKKVEENTRDDQKKEGRSKLELERRRAMALGQFSFLEESDRDVLDDTPALHDAVKTWKSSNKDERKRGSRINYEPAPETVDGEEKPTKTMRRSKGFDALVLPKAGETFVVVWVTSKGQVVVDKDVMLLNMKEVITTKEDQPDIAGPRDPKFAFVDRSDEGESDPGSSFDLDLFWSVGFLFKHFKSCGLMTWDKQMALLRREIRIEATEESINRVVKTSRRRSGSGEYQGKLIGWKGTYGFIQCTTGDYSNKTIFLHHTDIVSPYLHLIRGLQFRFDVVKEEDDPKKLRAIKAQPCLCKFHCTVHESTEEAAKKTSSPKGRRRRRSSKSSGSAKLSSSAEAAPNSNSDDAGSQDASSPGAAGEGEKRLRGKKRRQYGRKERKSDVESES